MVPSALVVGSGALPSTVNHEEFIKAASKDPVSKPTPITAG